MKAQSFITLDGSQSFSNFVFKDSNGKIDDSYKTLMSGGYSLGIRLQKTGLMVRFNAGIRKSGATLIVDNTNMAWNLQYADLKLGVGYELNKWKLKPYVSAVPYYSFLLRATQTINGLSVDIKENKSIKNSDYGLFLIPGLRFKASDYLSVYSEFSYQLGLQNIETNASQTLNNKGYSIALGLAITITKSNPKWIQGK